MQHANLIMGFEDFDRGYLYIKRSSSGLVLNAG